MSKQGFKLIIIAIIMFGLFKSLLGGVDNTKLQEAIEKGALLVDVRTPAEFAGGSVKGAVNIPLEKAQSQLNQFKNKEVIVVFCRSGNRSGQVKSILERNGFTNVVNGGTWQNVREIVGNSN